MDASISYKQAVNCDRAEGYLRNKRALCPSGAVVAWFAGKRILRGHGLAERPLDLKFN